MPLQSQFIQVDDNSPRYVDYVVRVQFLKILREEQAVLYRYGCGLFFFAILHLRPNAPQRLASQEATA
jgi:hypothetical protein